MPKYLTGGAQTTVNSTITELFPALCFNNGFRPKNTAALADFIKSVDVSSVKSQKTFVRSAAVSDTKQAQKFITQAFTLIQPKILQEKLQNAFGITNYLYEVNASNPIKSVVWGYRNKPPGVPENHAGDAFLLFKDGEIVGISLKAGTAKSTEPKLNTYVRTTLVQPYFRELDPKADINLKKRLWKEVYSKVGAPKSVNADNYFSIVGTEKRSSTRINPVLQEKLIRLNETNEKKFDELYQIQNKVSREELCKMINRDVNATKKWINEEFRLEKPQKVPLVLVKAVRENATEQGDKLVNFVSKITKVKAYLNKNSVQEWFIDVSDKAGNTLTLKMAARSDAGFRRTSPKGKLGKLVMLKVQYFGVVKK